MSTSPHGTACQPLLIVWYVNLSSWYGMDKCTEGQLARDGLETAVGDSENTFCLFKEDITGGSSGTETGKDPSCGYGSY